MATKNNDVASQEQRRPVLIRKETARAVLEDPEQTSHSLLMTVGGGITLLGLVELGLLWFPLGLGVAAWEFGTLSETFDVVPIAAPGVALLTYGIVRSHDVRTGVVRAASIAFCLLAVLFLLAGFVYIRAVPVVLAEAPAQAMDALYRSIIETATAVAVSIVACLLVARLLWRCVGNS